MREEFASGPGSMNPQTHTPHYPEEKSQKGCRAGFVGPGETRSGLPEVIPPAARRERGSHEG